MSSPLRRWSLLAALTAAFLVTFPAPAEETAAGPGTAGEPGIAEGLRSTAKPLFKALSMLGTPYKFGGSSPDKGIDCSGFVKHVYKESAGLSLPRSARDMSKEGEVVARQDLKPGDLVFFNTRKRPNSHVGIYKGDGEFVHASSSHTRKVTVSKMDQKYWATRFNGARRVLPSE